MSGTQLADNVLKYYVVVNGWKCKYFAPGPIGVIWKCWHLKLCSKWIGNQNISISVPAECVYLA